VSLKWIIVSIGTILVVAGFALLCKPPYCPPGMKQAEATVVGSAQVRQTFGWYSVAVIEFTPEGGEKVTVQLGEPSSYRVGSKLIVNYDPYDPARDWSISDTSDGSAYLVMALGIVMGAIGAFAKAP